MVRIGWSAELLIGSMRAVGWVWMVVVDGCVGCAVVVGGSEAVGGTLWWRYLVLVVEMGGWVVWSGIVGARCGTVEWEPGADCDGDGCGGLVMAVLCEAIGAWWVCPSDGVVGAKIDGGDGG